MRSSIRSPARKYEKAGLRLDIQDGCVWQCRINHNDVIVKLCYWMNERIIQRTRPVLRYSNVFTIVYSLQRWTPLVLDSSTQRGVQSAEPALSVSLFSLLCLSLSILILHWKRNLGRVAYSSIPIELSVSLAIVYVLLFCSWTQPDGG